MSNFFKSRSRSAQAAASTASTAATGQPAARGSAHASPVTAAGKALSLHPAPQADQPSAPLAPLKPSPVGNMRRDEVNHVASFLTPDEREAWSRTNHEFRQTVPPGADTRSLADEYDRCEEMYARVSADYHDAEKRYNNRPRSLFSFGGWRRESKPDRRALEDGWYLIQEVRHRFNQRVADLVVKTLDAPPHSALAKGLVTLRGTKDRAEQLRLMTEMIDAAGLSWSARASLPGADLDSWKLQRVADFLVHARYAEIQGHVPRHFRGALGHPVPLTRVRDIHHRHIPAAERTDPQVLTQRHIDPITRRESVQTIVLKGPGAQSHTFHFHHSKSHSTEYVIHLPALGEPDPPSQQDIPD